MPTQKRLLALFAGAAAALLAATPIAAADHTVDILTTPPGDGGTYTMRIEIENFELVPVGQKSTQERGEGHVHFIINDSPAPGDYATTESSYTFTGLNPGDVVAAELVHNDHASYEPRVIATQTVGESEDSPGLTPALLAGAALGLLAMARRRQG